MANVGARMTREEAEAFLFRETRLLDERRLDDWGALFADDGIYWLPIEAGDDPEREAAILCDDSRQRSMRIHQLLRHKHYAQVPPSRLVHFVTNVEVEDGAGDEARIRCSVLVCELRPGDFQGLQIGLGTQRVFACRCEYKLRREEDWRIAEKKVMLLDRDLPLSNLTFIL